MQQPVSADTPIPGLYPDREAGRMFRGVTGTKLAAATARPVSVNLARRLFFDEGRVPVSLVSHHVFASWSRCHALGLDPKTRPEHDTVGRNVLAEMLERRSALIRAAEPVVRSIVAQTDGDPNVVVLTDAGGMVLLTAGSRDFAAQARRREVRPGVPWAEDLKGTNAMGTALMERAPVVIHGAEHYLAVNSIFTCTAAPIHGPAGELVGVLDITGDARVLPPYSKAFARLAVELIEQQLFRQAYPLHALLRFHSRPEYIGALGEGLAVLASDGSLIAVNRVGRHLLGCGAADLRGLAFETVFDVKFSELCDLLRRAVQPLVRLHLQQGTCIYARLEGGEPAPFVLSSPATVARPASAEAPSLRQIEGDAVRSALDAERGNVSAAARRLGIARSTLYRKLNSAALRCNKATGTEP